MANWRPRPRRWEARCRRCGRQLDRGERCPCALPACSIESIDLTNRHGHGRVVVSLVIDCRRERSEIESDFGRILTRLRQRHRDREDASLEVKVINKRRHSPPHARPSAKRLARELRVSERRVRKVMYERH